MLRISLFIVLALIYAFLVNLIPSIEGYERWQIVAVLNAVIAIPFWYFYKPQVKPEGRFAWFVWLIGPLLLAGTIVLLQYSEQGESQAMYSTLDIFMLCLLVPLAEETIFRRTLYDDLSHRFPKIWVYYLSAFIFALAHSDPLNLSVPIGPFLLGLVAAWAYQVTGKISAAVLIHSAGNGVAILIALYAPTWLENLLWLYQRL